MSLQKYLEQSLSKSTAESYLYIIGKYKKYNKNADKYHYQNIIQYIELLRNKKKIGTIQMQLAALKKYYDYLIEIGKRKDNPAQAIYLKDAKENPIQLQDLFTEKELQTLLEPRKERYPFLAKRNQIIMSLLVHQALRPSELIQLKLTDLNLEKAEINITGTANTNSRTLALKAEQILLFYQYINQEREKLITCRTKENYLLINKLGTKTTTDDIHYLISTYQKILTKRLTTVTIRQSVIANLLSKGNDLRMVQYFAGHKHADTTEKYRQTGINALQTAIEKLHPLK